MRTGAAGGLIGREKIVGALLANLQKGNSTLLVGPSGIGKTAILRAVTDGARRGHGTRWPLYCGEAATLKAMLRNIAQEMASSCESGTHRMLPQSLGKLSIPRLSRLVAPRLRTGQYAVLLDHIGRVRGCYADFLDDLAERWRVPVIVALRSVDHAETGRMWWVGWNFQKIGVPELTPGETRTLIAFSLDRSGVSLPDREDFIRELTRIAHGHPGMIMRVCDLARATRYQVGGRTDLRLLLLDLKLRDLQERIDAESQIPLRGPIQLFPH